MPENPFDDNGDQWAWSATTLDWLQACPRLYYYNMILGLRPKSQKDDITFGLIYHAALEEYDRAQSRGASHEEALDIAMQLALKQSWGWTSESNDKNRATLIRSVVWYLEEFRTETDPLRTVHLSDGRPAVELSFRLELTPKIVLSGHLDRVVEYTDGQYVADRKTTRSALSAYYFNRYDPDIQMSLYTFASKVAYHAPVRGVIVDAAQVGVKFTRFARGFVHRTDDQLKEFIEHTTFWIGQVPSMKAADWPMNTASCQRYGGCTYRSVCSRSPHVRKSLLASEFERGDYNPLEIRGAE